MHTLSFSAAEAASWRLGSELVRRHPEMFLWLGRPGGGQYDVMFVEGRHGSVFTLNRTGSIAAPGLGNEEIIEWKDYLGSNPRGFIEGLERRAELQPPGKLPASTPRVLTYRVLAVLASLGFQTLDPLIIGLGSGPMGSSEIDIATLVPTVDPAALLLGPNDPFGHPGYRFWLLGEEPRTVPEQETGRGWCADREEPVSIPAVYAANGRNIVRTAIEVAEYLDVHPVGRR